MWRISSRPPRTRRVDRASPPGESDRSWRSSWWFSSPLLSLLSVVAGYVRGESARHRLLRRDRRTAGPESGRAGRGGRGGHDQGGGQRRASTTCRERARAAAARDGPAGPAAPNSDRRLADALNSALSGLGPLLQNQLARGDPDGRPNGSWKVRASPSCGPRPTGSRTAPPSPRFGTRARPCGPTTARSASTSASSSKRSSSASSRADSPWPSGSRRSTARSC